jgi:hypothetical protein
MLLTEAVSGHDPRRIFGEVYDNGKPATRARAGAIEPPASRMAIVTRRHIRCADGEEDVVAEGGQLGMSTADVRPCLRRQNDLALGRLV